MVDTSDVAIGAAALGGAYYLSQRTGGGADGGNKRPGRIPLPVPSGGSGGGLSPGIAGLLASGQLGGGGQQLGGQLSSLGDRLSGLLGQQQQGLAKLAQGQQAGLGKLFEQQRQLFGALSNQQTGGNASEQIAKLREQIAGVNMGNQPGTNYGPTGGSSSSKGEMTGTQKYRLAAADAGNIAPEARGANPILEAARGAGEATGATLRLPSKAVDYGADVIGGDSPGAFSKSGGITGASYEAGATVGKAIDKAPPVVAGGLPEAIQEGSYF